MTRLSTVLRTSTAQAHEDAERSPFMTRLLAGDGIPADFSALTAQLYPVYAALEAALDRFASHPVVAAVHDPALARTDRLASDLAELYGPTWAARRADGSIPTLPATAVYVDRLIRLDRPEALVAHHYVRYLGDLSGGQIVARLVARHYGVPAEALSFYRFEAIPKRKAYKDAYRARLDALALDDRTRALVVATAIEAFGLNRAVFTDLETARHRRPLHVA
ncbi:Heme oxygenase [Nostocoides japonicum T1-X7]|uniref:heme oxygenase (biliverdin-producing) n=1 Tax=Nostocoides japonicum T1-X7 TaxID=1194083 RepID=A0A077M8A5_9MICO|nr:biliverdin-producing heme oxygenase [Tetrasphaera japonica]CCH80294.1 Heme oxygenase [Tetrasphaera japonica T1-X7]